MTSSFTFRRATLNDLGELHRLYEETIRKTCCHDYSPEQIEAWVSTQQNIERWEDAIRHQYFLLAVIKDNLAGFGSLKNGDHIDFLYASTQYIGQGVGSFIYNTLEHEAVRQEKNCITANVSKTALPFFINKGFVITHENDNLIGQVHLNNYHMEKLLNCH